MKKKVIVIDKKKNIKVNSSIDRTLRRGGRKIKKVCKTKPCPGVNGEKCPTGALINSTDCGCVFCYSFSLSGKRPESSNSLDALFRSR